MPTSNRSKPIEDYAMIGDGGTAALIARDGSVDWLCWPRFDSDACFAALLGDDSHGVWRIAPTSEAMITRRYLPDTLILETEFETDTGRLRITDFMPPRCEGIASLVAQAGGSVRRGRDRLRGLDPFRLWRDPAMARTAS